MQDLTTRANATTLRTYCRPLTAEDNSLLESWPQVIERSHVEHHRWLYQQAGGTVNESELTELRQLGLARQSLVSGRTLWLGGTEYSRSRPCCNFNCAWTPLATVYDLVDASWLLLNGTGVGCTPQMGTLHGYVRPIPELKIIPTNKGPYDKGNPHTKESCSEEGIWRIRLGDSAEAWAKAIGKLFNPCFQDRKITTLVLDGSGCRGPGGRLAGYGWICNGPEPMLKAMAAMHEILNARHGNLLNELDIMDVVNHVGQILSSRRAAEAMLMDFNNPHAGDFAQAKKDYWIDNPQRRQSNNSFLYWNKPSRKQLLEQLHYADECGGDPGIVNAEGARNKAPWFEGFNPSLRKGTKVLTSQGIFPIEELEGKNVQVRNLTGDWAPAVCRLSGKNKPLYKITLQGDHCYYATAEHKWPVYLNGRYIKQETTDLRPGDRLPVNKQSYLYDGHLGTLDEGFLVGWILGDGWVTRRADTDQIQVGLIVGKKDADAGIKDKLLRILRDMGCDASFRPSTQGDSEELITCNKKLVALLDKVKYQGKEKLPGIVWNESTEEFRRGLVDGLFSADGNICCHAAPRFSISSSRESLMRELAELLGFYGIKATLSSTTVEGKFPNGKDYGKKYTSYRLKSSCLGSTQHFAELFSLSHTRKEEDLQRVKYATSRRRQNDNKIAVVSVEKTDLHEDVWDLSVFDDSHCFQLGFCVTGNCYEILLGAFCNLTSNVLPRFRRNFSHMERAIYLIARANYRQTCVNLQDGILQPRWHQTNQALRLCGVSLTGIVQCDWLTDYQIRRLRNAAITGAYSMADELGLPRPKAVTCIKPEGCRPGDGLVTTEQGIYTLDEMLEDHPEGDAWAPVQKSLTSWIPGDLPRKYTKTFDNGEAEVFEIRLSYGMCLRSTANHPWFVTQHYDRKRGQKNKYQPVNDYVETSKLRTGDLLAIYPGVYNKQEHAPLDSFVSAAIKFRSNQQTIRTPSHMNPELAWLLGYLWGDGCMLPAHYRFRFIDGKVENLRKLQTILKELFDITAEIVPASSGKNASVLEFGSVHLWHWMLRNDFWKYHEEDIDRIPRKVRESSKEDIIAFFAGLLDADGCVCASERNCCKTITLATAAEDFGRHVQDVGWTVGLAFGRSLNSLGDNRQPGRKRIFLLSLSSVTTRDAAELLLKHSTKMQAGLADPLPWFYEVRSPNRNPGKVLAVVPLGKMPTADVEVEETHRFLAGCVHSHNTLSKIADCTEGIHRPLGRYLFNWINFSIHDKIVGLCETAGYKILPNPQDKNNVLVCFPVEYASVKFDKVNGKEVNLEPATAQLDRYLRWNNLWCDHNVSATISYSPEELPEVADWLDQNWDRGYIATAFLRRVDPTRTARDLGHPYLPQEVVDRETFESYRSQLRPVNFDSLTGYHDLDTEDCAKGSCPVK